MPLRRLRAHRLLHRRRHLRRERHPHVPRQGRHLDRVRLRGLRVPARVRSRSREGLGLPRQAARRGRRVRAERRAIASSPRCRRDKPGTDRRHAEHRRHAPARRRARDVVELHGSLWRVRCDRENIVRDDTTVADEPAQVQLRRPTGGRTSCGSRTSSITATSGARVRRSRQCDLLVSVGTSGVVYPAADLPRIAMRARRRDRRDQPRGHAVSAPLPASPARQGERDARVDARPTSDACITARRACTRSSSTTPKRSPSSSRARKRIAVLGIKTEAQADQPAFYVPKYLRRRRASTSCRCPSTTRRRRPSSAAPSTESSST